MQDDMPSLELESFDDIAEEDKDDATLLQSHSTSLISTQYVVYSATFQVPAFYFTIHDSRA
jgi:ubiquitin-like-conjugating enzyme ATG10